MSVSIARTARLGVVAAWVVSLLLVSGAPARAQAVYGSVAGNVVDSTGAVMPGVNVTVTSVERNTSDTVVTNGSGNYTKDRLLPGTYEVKAELSGFNAALAKGIRVSVDTQTKVDLKLAPGATDTITVVGGEGQLLKTDRADVATTFDQRQVTELPILDRNFTKFLLLTPGTQQQSWGHAASENPQGSAQTVVNGQTFSGTGYQLDGTDNRDPILGIIVINPTLESIGESKVTSQNYEAEFGQAIAGVVAVQTKSGRNELYGSAFEFHRTDKFQARNPFSEPDVENPLTGRVLPETKKDQFGLSLGGPLKQRQVLLLRRLPGHAQLDRRRQAPDRPHRAGTPGQLQRVWRQHLRPDRWRSEQPPAVRRQRHPDEPPLAAGARHPQPAAAAERTRHPRQLHRPGQRSVRQRCGQPPA